MCGGGKTEFTTIFFFYFHRRLITDSKVKLKYQHLITNSFVEVSFPLEFVVASRVSFVLHVY